jgi:hypothetical protein
MADVEASFRGNLLAPLGNERDLMRLEPASDRHHLIRAGHFEVERHVKLILKALNVVILDMAAILSQVRRNAMSSGIDRGQSGKDRIWFVGTPRLSDRGDVVDVHV